MHMEMAFLLLRNVQHNRIYTAVLNNTRPSRVFFPNGQMCFWWASSIRIRVAPPGYGCSVESDARFKNARLSFLLGRYKLLYIELSDFSVLKVPSRFCNMILRLPRNR